MIFIVTNAFSKTRDGLLGDDELRQLQVYLMLNPQSGSVIQGSGGLRKLRWNELHRGKRGGLRVIYYWIQARDRIYLLSAYRKSRIENLTQGQLSILKSLIGN